MDGAICLDSIAQSICLQSPCLLLMCTSYVILVKGALILQAPHQPPNTGSLKGIGIDGAEPIQLTTSLAWYNSSDGLDVPEGKDRGQAGGAYIFR